MKPLEEMGRFKTVVVDPPWPISFGNLTREEIAVQHAKKIRELGTSYNGHGDGGKSFGRYAKLDYETLSLAEIAEIGIERVCDVDCMVFLWTTQGFLPNSFDILKAWGLRYWCTMTWQKAIGPKPLNRPYYNSEFVLLAAKGKPCFVSETGLFACNAWKARGHSSKPEEFYDLLRRVTPAPRLDVFGRRPIAGFQSWGNEAPDGPAPAGHYQDVLDL